MKHVIIGTAGHVDHGKTTLIKALTGTDTDRLKEEQERGMTIDLGFASMVFPDGSVAGIVDVPGHERFLKNMLAGAGGVDIAILVVAADESFMPQTTEHLEILKLLGVQEGVVALTKADMVESEWLEVVKEDVRQHLVGCFLGDKPIVGINSITSDGIADLKKALFACVSRVEARNRHSPVRMPIDRVFTRPGFGPVVTGSLIAGTVHVGDTLAVYPEARSVRVRGIQTHGKSSQEAAAGTRTAINLAGIELDDLERGGVLAAPGSIVPSQVFDASVSLLEGAPRPLAHRTRIRLHLGTAEVIGRVKVIGGDTIEPGKSGYVQVRLDSAVSCARGDRFVLRAYSPMRTIAGGVVLDPNAARHRASDTGVIDRLKSRERGTPEDVVGAQLLASPHGSTVSELALRTGLVQEDLASALEALAASGGATRLGRDLWFAAPTIETLLARMSHLLEEFHRSSPLKPGMPKEELRAALMRSAPPAVFGNVVGAAVDRGIAAVEGPILRLASFRVELNPKQQALLDRVLSALDEAGFAVPSIDELSRSVGAPPEAIRSMIRVGLDRGEVVKVTEDMLWTRRVRERAVSQLKQHFRAKPTLTVAEYRDLSGTSRKYAVPALEYLDGIGVTRRQGDERVWSGGPLD